jgi:hypothetical protein
LESTQTNTRGLYVALKKGVAVRDRRVYRLLGKMRALCPWLEESDSPACRARTPITLGTYSHWFRDAEGKGGGAIERLSRMVADDMQALAGTAENRAKSGQWKELDFAPTAATA